MERPAADPGARDDAGPLDAEQAERLSRAARDVVHQPADPRLEKAFGHLGLFPDPPPDEVPPPGAPPVPDSPVAPRTVPDGPVTPIFVPSDAPVDVEPLRVELASLRAAVERLDRRIGTVIGMLALLAVVVGVLAVIVFVR